MIKIFEEDRNNCLRVIDNKKFCYGGPRASLDQRTVIDSFFVNDFTSGEYTISIELNNAQREIIKCLLVVGSSAASITIYGRSTTETELIDLTATIADNKVLLIAVPKNDRVLGAQIIFSAQLYKALIN